MHNTCELCVGNRNAIEACTQIELYISRIMSVYYLLLIIILFKGG